jgi:hypothetical protein
MIVTTHICNACGGGIKFVDRKPYNSDGTVHWDSCKERQYEVVRKNGVYYRTDNEAGYLYKGEKWPTWRRGPVVTGSEYTESNCDCGVPPWELCKDACLFFAHNVSRGSDRT